MTPRDDTGPSRPDTLQQPSGATVASLLRNLGDPDPQVQWQAAEALGRCGKEVVPRLIGALRSPSVPVRLGALEALGTLREPRAADRIIALLGHDPAIEVRWAAALTLGEIGSPEIIPALRPFLRDRNRYIRHGAAMALDKLGWKPADPAEMAYFLIARQDWEAVSSLGEAALPPLWDLLRDDDPKTRAVIVSLIGRLSGADAQAACQAALRDRDPRVRWQAVLAALDCGVASHELPLMVAGRERTRPDPAAAAILNFLFFGIGYNYIGKWWGFPVFMGYMFIVFLTQITLFLLHMPTVIALFMAYPVTAILGVHTYFLAERMSDEGIG